MSDIIDELLAADDATLMKKFGYSQKLASAREDLIEAGKLSGDARSSVVERINSMLTPTIYGDEIGYAVDSAKRRAANKGKTTPSSMLSACGCDVAPGDD